MKGLILFRPLFLQSLYKVSASPSPLFSRTSTVADAVSHILSLPEVLRRQCSLRSSFLSLVASIQVQAHFSILLSFNRPTRLPRPPVPLDAPLCSPTSLTTVKIPTRTGSVGLARKKDSSTLGRESPFSISPFFCKWKLIRQLPNFQLRRL